MNVSIRYMSVNIRHMNVNIMHMSVTIMQVSVTIMHMSVSIMQWALTSSTWVLPSSTWVLTSGRWVSTSCTGVLISYTLHMSVYIRKWLSIYLFNENLNNKVMIYSCSCSCYSYSWVLISNTSIFPTWNYILYKSLNYIEKTTFATQVFNTFATRSFLQRSKHDWLVIFLTQVFF